MASTLVFPDGVRLADEETLRWNPDHYAADWARVQSANIAAGFVLDIAKDPQFSFYAEANVDAPCLWTVFCDLCLNLLGPVAELAMSVIDDEPDHLGQAHTTAILNLLGQHSYQLANDGFIQFGLIEEYKDSLTEVFVAPTKHFKVWLNDEKLFRSIMKSHGVPEADKLEFLDEYPRRTIRLPENKIMFHSHSEFINYLRKEIVDLSAK
jgi:hypothetical protein